MKFRNMALGLMLSAAPVAGFASNDSQSILSFGAKAVTANINAMVKTYFKILLDFGVIFEEVSSEEDSSLSFLSSFIVLSVSI